jgi:hypothetical protein
MRIGIGALLLAALVAAFSLHGLPRPLTADLAAEAFDAPAGLTTTRTLSAQFPDRRAGSPGDAALAAEVATRLKRVLPAASVTTDRFEADTPDGRRTLENVTAVLPGLPGPEILIVAHRDAVRRDSAAEMTGTAALIGLAQAAGRGRFRHTIRFVSTSGGSGGGLPGATRLARTGTAQVAAALVLGDLAGGRRPRVVPWSNGMQAAPLRLLRTAEESLRAEGLRPAESESLWMQLVRRGLPGSVGEQAELNQGGIPSVLVSAGGATPPAADARVDGAAFRAYGRAALRSVSALDSAGTTVGEPQTGLVISGQELPAWALRVLLLTALVPLAGAALVLGIALHRDGIHLLAGAAWTIGCVVGPLVAGLVAVGAGRVGLAWPAVPAPFAGEAVRTGFGAGVLVVVLVAILVAATAVARPFLTREATGHRTATRPAVSFGVFGLLLTTILALLVINPVSALLFLPALLAWPAAVAPVPGVRPLHRVGLTLAGALLPLAAVVSVASSLDVGPAQYPWWLVLLIAGGHVAPLYLLLTSFVVGAGIAVTLTLVPPVRNPWSGRRARPLRDGTPDGGRGAAGPDGGPDAPDRADEGDDTTATEPRRPDAADEEPDFDFDFGVPDPNRRGPARRRRTSRRGTDPAPVAGRPAPRGRRGDDDPGPSGRAHGAPPPHGAA